MEINKYSKSIWVLLLAVFFTSGVLAVGVSQFEEEYTFFGVVTEIDKEANLFTVRMDPSLTLFEEDEVEVGVFKGDVEVGYLGRAIRGKLRVDSDPMHLHTIWPMDEALEEKAANINAILHYDTLMKPGNKAEKRIGDKMPEFALWNQEGQLITHKDLPGKVVVLNFIYTRCNKPDMCPAATKFMVELQGRAKEKGFEDVLFLTVTFDPIYDTPGVLRHYSLSYGVDSGNYHFLTGDPTAISNLMRQFGIYTVSRKGTVDHTMRTAIINKEGYILYAESDMVWSTDNFLKRIGRML